MRKKILIGLGVLVGIVLVFLGIVAMQPTDYKITRSAVIAAPPNAVFAHVNDFHLWDAWSPWAKLDPNAKNSFDGPAYGEGAKFAWSGNDDVGEGSMEILKSQPAEHIDIKLAFVRPFEDQCAVAFDFKPQGEQTEVVWKMEGKNNFIGKIFCLFMNMDEMVGKDFEKGLANMKQVVESEPVSKPLEDVKDEAKNEPTKTENE